MKYGLENAFEIIDLMPVPTFRCFTFLDGEDRFLLATRGEGIELN